MDAVIKSRIEEEIKAKDVVLFMKGTRQAPRCGFSATVVGILDSLIDDYGTVDVLADENIRQGIKEFSDWPTIPQLYVKGEFVGGCDIVRDMFETGQLEETLGIEAKPVEPPSISVSEKAAGAIKQALQGDDELVRLEIDARFNNSLSIGPKQERDLIVETAGLTIAVDRASAGRANGVSIDYVDTPQGAAFRIENPNEPPGVRAISAPDLKAKIDASSDIELFDVRTEQERQIASIPSSRLLDRGAQQHIMSLSKDTPLYFFCHHGGRSQQAAEFFINNGFKEVYNLSGGIDAWAQQVDPKTARY